MAKIKNYFIDEKTCIDISTVKSRVLKQQFNLSTNTIVAFINPHEQESLTFIFEKKCSKETLHALSKLFLMTIQLSFPDTFNVTGFELLLETHKMSKYSHYHGKQSRLFCHSIVLRSTNESSMVAHTNIPPKDFAITILNHFQTQLSDIF